MSDVAMSQEQGPTELQQSFFMAAGAGSGKTGALVSSAQFLISRKHRELSESRSKLAVITYTKAAAAEVQRRIASDELVAVSTIHSFAWQMIGALTPDLRKWRLQQLEHDLQLLREKESKGRSGTEASEQRLRSIVNKETALASLPTVARFTYNPDSSGQNGNSLNHGDVLSAFAYFCETQSLFRTILSAKHPVIFVDEVQDTREDVLRALIGVANDESVRLQLGLFGDPMQRIYLDGPPNLPDLIPADWDRPVLPLNYRSGSRIVELLNKLRYGHDEIVQYPRSREPGAVRLFIEDTTRGADESEEADEAEKAAGAWLRAVSEPKVLILEHALAARRLGFRGFLDCFSEAPSALRSELFASESATWPALHFVQTIVSPLHNATVHDDRPAVSRILQAANQTSKSGPDSIAELRSRAAALFNSLKAPQLSAQSALSAIITSDFFSVPQLLVDAAEERHSEASIAVSDDDKETSRVLVWRKALKGPLVGLLQLALYTTGQSTIDTQQGTKGLEYGTVLAILDDSASRGNTFKYDKLFGTVSPSQTDEDNIANGRDNVVDRTRRLFYVACSRARDRLAVVIRTAEPAETEKSAIRNGWFRSEEIERVR